MENPMSSSSTTTKRTPTPYAVKKGLHGNPEGVTIWQDKPPGMVGAKGIAKMSLVHEQDEVEATAAFIVHACNSHEQLAAALRSGRVAIDVLMAQLIELDPSFMPTKSAAWPALVAIKAALDVVEV
jgi:hypothetical protein